MSKLFLLLCLLQSAPVGEYEAATNRTFYVLRGKSATEPRRIAFAASHPGKDRAPIDAVTLSFEVKQHAVRTQSFTEWLSIQCANNAPTRRTLPINNSTMDAETLAISAQLKPDEARALLACDAPRLTLAGIEVTPSKELLAQLRAVLTF